MYIVEVGPRDGLQNEKAIIPTEDKVALINSLNNIGVQEIEVSAFVSAKRIPQLHDAEEVFNRIARKEGVIYSALVPNVQGLERAMAVQVDKLSLFTAASETFNQKNIHTSIEGSLQRFKDVLSRTSELPYKIRGYISTSFHCPFEGKISAQAVKDLSVELLAMGVDECAISDTIGKASRDDVKEVFDVLCKDIDPQCLAVHFHDTYGNASENIKEAYDYGIRTFDGSIAGLGGCPYAPGAPGNVSTRHVFAALGTKHSKLALDSEALSAAEQLTHSLLNKAGPS